MQPIVKAMIAIVVVLLFNSEIKGQDSLYAREIDSLWLRSYSRHELLKKKEKNGGIRFDYSFYKRTGKLRDIVVWHMPEKPNLFIFFYIDDKVVMISPVGQPPYYISGNSLVYAKEKLHSAEEIQTLIIKANEYLLQSYKILNNRRKFQSTDQ